jgi:hypothetical protein
MEGKNVDCIVLNWGAFYTYSNKMAKLILNYLLLLSYCNIKLINFLERHLGAFDHLENIIRC